MAELVNLNRVRKARARAAARDEAAGNRAKFGRSRSETEAAALARRRAESDLDGKKRET